MVSKARLLLPEPLTPVSTVSRPRGRSRLKPCRLCVRAPRTRMTSGGGAMQFSLTGGGGAGKLASAAREPRENVPPRRGDREARPDLVLPTGGAGENGFSQGVGESGPITRD